MFLGFNAVIVFMLSSLYDYSYVTSIKGIILKIYKQVLHVDVTVS